MPANAKIRGKNIHPVHKMQYQNVKNEPFRAQDGPLRT